MTHNKKPAGGITPQAGFDYDSHPHHSPIKSQAKAFAIAITHALPTWGGVLVLGIIAVLVEVLR